MDIITMILACSLYSDGAVVNAMMEKGSNNNPLVISGKPFKTQDAALSYAKKLQAEGTPFTIGLMQIPDRWLKDKPVSLRELLRPCKNMVIATQLLNEAMLQCDNEKSCALSVYQTGNEQDGLAYANQILQYAADHPFTPPPPAE